MKIKTMNEAIYQIPTATDRITGVAICPACKHVAKDGIKTLFHGKQTTVCKHCLGELKPDFVPVVVGSKANAKNVLYNITISGVFANATKAYLLVNGYTQVKKGVFRSNDFTSLSGVSKVFNEIKGTDKHGKTATFSVCVFRGSKSETLKNVKAIDDIKTLVKNEF